MDSIPRPRAAPVAQSGGKILRGRRAAARRRTPYDRPSPSPPPPVARPNWLTGFVFPATRKIANGAGKFLSSVFNPESSSSSSSDDELDSENDLQDESGHEVQYDGLGGINERNGTSENVKYTWKEPQQIVDKNETKHVIEQLLLQETYSRDERDRLIKIINSRVVDSFTIKEGQDGRQTEILCNVPGSDSLDICNKAVREARKWLEEKRMMSSPEFDMNHGTKAFNSLKMLKATEGEVGSPVDMAKLYMKARPPWVSPSCKHTELKTPPPTNMEVFKGETLNLSGEKSWPSSKKRDSAVMGSWNINEEIRKVRSKATEELLQNVPSAKIDLSSNVVEPETDPNYSSCNKTFPASKDEEFESTIAAKPIKESSGMSVDVRTEEDFAGIQDPNDEALASYPTEKNQQKDLEGNQNLDEVAVASRSHESASLEHASAPDSGPKSADEKGIDIPMEETCELMSETSVEVPVVDENIRLNDSDNEVNGSPNSSSMQHEDLSQPNSETSLAKKASGGHAKQQIKRAGRYSRRTRGKGK